MSVGRLTPLKSPLIQGGTTFSRRGFTQYRRVRSFFERTTALLGAPMNVVLVLVVLEENAENDDESSP
jgi:hypothetical protein